jgi:hypothetical protein
MKTLNVGQQVTVNGNREAQTLSYDNELDMWNVRMWSGTRHVGDIVVPACEVHES